MTPYEIPLSPEPQKFIITLGGLQVQVRLYWCAPLSAWTLDILDIAGNDILLSAPLVTGCDLLAQHKHLGIPGSLVVQTDHDTDAVPTFDSLGVTGRLYFFAL